MLPLLRPPTPKGYSNNSIRDVYYHHLILMRGVSNRHRLTHCGVSNRHRLTHCGIALQYRLTHCGIAIQYRLNIGYPPIYSFLYKQNLRRSLDPPPVVVHRARRPLRPYPYLRPK